MAVDSGVKFSVTPVLDPGSFDSLKSELQSMLEKLEGSSTAKLKIKLGIDEQSLGKDVKKAIENTASTSSSAQIDMSRIVKIDALADKFAEGRKMLSAFKKELHTIIDDDWLLSAQKSKGHLGDWIKQINSMHKSFASLKDVSKVLEEVRDFGMENVEGVDWANRIYRELDEMIEKARAFGAEIRSATLDVELKHVDLNTNSTGDPKAIAADIEEAMNRAKTGVRGVVEEARGLVSASSEATTAVEKVGTAVDSVDDKMSAIESVRESISSLAVAMQQVSDTIKVDETGLSTLSRSIEEAIQRASQNIKLTIDNVELSAAAQKKIADNAQQAASGGSKAGSAGSGGIKEAGDELSRLIALYQQYYDALKKAEQARSRNDNNNVVMYTDLANAAEIAINKILQENSALQEQAEATRQVQTAMLSYAEVKNRAQSKEDNQAAENLKHEEEAAREASAALQEKARAQREADAAAAAADAAAKAKEEQDALNGLVALYQQYYELSAKKISQVNRGDIENADISRAAAEAAWNEIAAIEALNPKLAELAGSHEKVRAAFMDYQNAVNSGQARSDTIWQRNAAAAEGAATKWEDAVRRMESSFSKLGLDASGIKFSGDAEAVTRYKAELEKLSAALAAVKSASADNRGSAVAAYEAQRTAVEALRKSLNQAVTDAEALQRATKLADKIDIWKQNNPTAYNNAKTQVDQWLATLRSGAPLAAAEISNIASQFNHVANQERLAGNNGKTFFQQLKAGWSKFGGWSIVTRSFTKVISTMKQAVTAVKEVDAAMTELRKVTDLSERQYTSLYNNMVKMSGQIGSKLSDVITSVGDFSRLGFSASEALNLSEAALVYFNVGDQLENINEATESLISTMKAFGIEASNAMSIVDMFNEVGARLLPIPVVTRCLAECYIGQSSVGLCA